MQENDRKNLESVLRAQLEKQYRTGMYTALSALSIAIRSRIDTFRKKPRRRIADYETVLREIERLCSVNLISPSDEESTSQTQLPDS